MYDQTTEAATATAPAAACFDPNNISEAAAATAISAINGNNMFISHETNNNNNHNHQTQESDSSMEFHQNPNNNLGNGFITTHLPPPMLPNCIPNPNDHDPNSWGPTNLPHDINNNGFIHFDENLQPTTDLLTLLNLPRCSFTSTSNTTTSLSFGKPSSPPPSGSALGFLGDLNPPLMMDNPSGSGSSTISYDPSSAAAAAAAAFSYDPLFHLNLPPQPSPLLRDLIYHQTLPNGYNGVRGNNNGIVGNNNGSSSSLFGGLDDGEGNTINGIGGIYQDGDHHLHGNGVFEFSKGDGKGGKRPKNFVTERQRRQNFNDKYQHLRSLVPNQTKGDRASIVWDAINHINELRRTVGELKLLVEKKRMSKERLKRHKTDHQDTPAGGVGGTTSTGGGDHQSNGVDGPAVVKPDPDEEFNGSAAIQLRSSWIQRKCKDTEVDVRIVDDDVTIKLVQRKKINCLLFVSRTLDELQLDLRHVAGGHVGDYYSYLFNSKICEGSSVYASAIANKLIDVVERQYAAASVAVAPTTSF